MLHADEYCDGDVKDFDFVDENSEPNYYIHREFGDADDDLEGADNNDDDRFHHNFHVVGAAFDKLYDDIFVMCLILKMVLLSNWILLLTSVIMSTIVNLMR